jgi:hypothetical protein
METRRGSARDPSPVVVSPPNSRRRMQSPMDDSWLPSYFSRLVDNAKEHWVPLGAHA